MLWLNATATSFMKKQKIKLPETKNAIEHYNHLASMCSDFLGLKYEKTLYCVLGSSLII